jgi:DNA-binding transcriptional regulator YdaS (Cro superfamily)
MAYYRKNGIPPKMCVQIEKMTKGVVTRKMLREHDFAEIWPELGE